MNERYVAAVLVVALLGLVWLVQPQTLEVKDLTTDLLKQVLGTLFLIALLVERSLEVIVTAWRGREAAVLRLVVLQRARQLVAEQRPANNQPVKTQVDTAVNELHTVETDEEKYKNDTQRLAFIVAVVTGLLISFLGFRTLHRLVVADSINALESWQRTLFNVMDVLLTGLVIGGGSEGIHKILQAVLNFFDLTSRRLRNLN